VCDDRQPLPAADGVVHAQRRRKRPNSNLKALIGGLRVSTTSGAEEPIMNIYDPADFIVYVTMDRALTMPFGAGSPDLVETRLSRGYANGSPRTRLRNRAAIRPSQWDVHPALRTGALAMSLPEPASPWNQGHLA
jgi:hypothetical protein